MSYYADGSVPVQYNLTCDMREDCREPVTMVDASGFVYCADHGLYRRIHKPCRKLRGWELRRLARGVPLNRY